MPSISKVIGELQDLKTTETNRTILYSTTSINPLGQQSTSYNTENHTFRNYTGWVKKLSDGREQKIGGSGSLDARPGHTIAIASYNDVDLLEINYTTGTVFTRKNIDGMFLHLFRALAYTLLGFIVLPINLLVSLIEYGFDKHCPNVFANCIGLPAARKANLLFGLGGSLVYAIGAYYMISSPSIDVAIGVAVAFFTLSLWLSGWIDGQSKQLISKLLTEFNNEYEAHQVSKQAAEAAQIKAEPAVI